MFFKKTEILAPSLSCYASLGQSQSCKAGMTIVPTSSSCDKIWWNNAWRAPGPVLEYDIYIDSINASCCYHPPLQHQCSQWVVKPGSQLRLTRLMPGLFGSKVGAHFIPLFHPGKSLQQEMVTNLGQPTALSRKSLFHQMTARITLACQLNPFFGPSLRDFLLEMSWFLKEISTLLSSSHP